MVIAAASCRSSSAIARSRSSTFRTLPVTIVRDADDLHVAAADDHVLDPSDDCHVPVLVHDREVAGVHPAAPSITSAVRSGSSQ